MLVLDHSAQKWFEEAARCYLEKHQGCAWCGGSYRVYQVHKGNHIIYFCQGCDFQAGFDKNSGKYSSVPGEESRDIDKKTMYKI